MIEEILLAVLAVMAWSVLYKQNPLFRVAESMTVGLTLAFVVYTGIDVLGKRVFTPWSQGVWLTPTTVAALLGFMSWTRLGPRSIGWISRWPLACLAGIGTGLAVKGVVGPQILGQLSTGSLIASDLLTSVNNVIIVAATVTTLCYFTFSYRHTGVLGASARVGRMFMMLSFGATLGGFVMTAMGYLIGHMFVIVKPPAVYIAAVALAVIGADVIRSGRTM
jgi:hypothetical protein